MSTGGLLRTAGGGYQSSTPVSSSSCRPPGSAAATTTPPGSSSSHRNRNLLDSYHDFAMQIFGNSNQAQDIEVQFLQAVEDGDSERVENLLKRRSHEIFNIDIKDKETGNTPIIYAARLGHLRITQLLLKYGADVTLRNFDNETALDVARPNVIKPLLDSVERVGASPRHLLQAAWQGDLSTTKRLLAESRILDINCRNSEGFTPLLLVTRDVELFEKLMNSMNDYDPLAVVNELLRHRGDAIAKDLEGKTALHYASASHSKIGQEIAFTLMRDTSLLEKQDNRSSTPIHSASQSGQIRVVLAMLDKGVDVNARGFAGSTPLHVSACNGHYQLSSTLLDHGADITLVDDSGNTAVTVAKTKKLKNTLKEAWTEATQTKQEVILAPVKPPSRMGGESDERSPREGVPDVSPREKLMLRRFSDAHKAVIAEEQAYKDLENSHFTTGPSPRKPGYSRSCSRNSNPAIKAPIPPKTPRAMEKRQKPPRSPEKTQRSMSFHGKGEEPKCQRVRGHAKLGHTRSDPTARVGGADGSQVPVTIVGLDLDESLRDIRMQRLISGPVGSIMERQQQSNHDRLGTRLSQMPTENYQPPTTAALASPSVTDVTTTCSEYMKKVLPDVILAVLPDVLATRRSTRIASHQSVLKKKTVSFRNVHNQGRKLGMRKMSACTDDSDSVVSWPRAKNKSPRKSHLLNLEQMHLRLNTPSPMSDFIHMFPNSRCVLPQSPAMASGEFAIGETIFEFENENDGTLYSSHTSTMFGGTTRRRSLNSSHSYYSHKAMKISDSVQRTVQGHMSDESNSPESSQEQSDKVITPSIFNIELSRVSPLKDSSDSGQGSSRSTVSQGSSFSTDSNPSPLLMNAEQESLAKVAVKNRLGIGMTPAATGVQVNSRQHSKLSSYSRTDEVRDFRRGLVKSVLPTSISISGVHHQLGSLQVEKQPELQPLVAKKDEKKDGTTRLSTVSENPASRPTSQSKHQRRRTVGDAGQLSAEASRRLSLDEGTTSKSHPSARRGSKGESINKLSVLPGVASIPVEEMDIDSCTVENTLSSSKKKETEKKTTVAKKDSNETLVIKRLATAKQTTESCLEPDSKAKDCAVSSSGVKTNTAPTVRNSADDAKTNVKTLVPCADSKTNRTLSKPNSQNTPNQSAITNSKLSSQERATKHITETTSGNSQSLRKTNNLESTNDDLRKSGIPSKSKQNCSQAASKSAPLDAKETSSNATASQKATAVSAESINSKKPSSPSPRKLDGATISLTEVAPGPSVSKGKPSLSKSFNSSGDKSGIESELKKAKEEIRQENENTGTTKTIVVKPAVSGQTSTSNDKQGVAKSMEKKDTNKKAVSDKPTSSNINKMESVTKEPSKPAPVNQMPNINPQSNTNVINKAEVSKDTSKPVSGTAKQANALVQENRKVDNKGTDKPASATKPASVTPQINKTVVESSKPVPVTTSNGNPVKTKNVVNKEVSKPVSATESANVNPQQNKTVINKETSKPTPATKIVNGNSQLNKNIVNKETAKPLKKNVNASSQSNKTTANKNSSVNSSKKRPEDSSKRTSDNKSNANSKQSTVKKLKVNHPAKGKADNVRKDNRSDHIRASLDTEEEDFSDAESMEDVEEMFESVTFISDEEHELEEVEQDLEDVVHIEIKTQEEMLAEEPKPIEKKEKKPNRTKIHNKTQGRKDEVNKGKDGSTVPKGGKTIAGNKKSIKASNSNKAVSAPTKTTKKATPKGQQNQGSKSAGNVKKSTLGTTRRTTVSVKQSVSVESLLEDLSGKSQTNKSNAENTPVITDIMEVIKAVNKGVTPTPWRRSVSTEELSSSPRKKSTSPKRDPSVKTRARVSSERVVSGSKGKGQSTESASSNKSVKKQSAGNVNKDGFATSKTGKQSKVTKQKLKDLQLLSESEKQTTAFITGQGWQIKTDRNETEDVIIHDPLDDDDSSDSSDVEMEGPNLSPHHSLNLNKMKLNTEVIHNLANILSPLEDNTPRFMPDTMGTIKEFADSLKSNDSGDLRVIMRPEESNNNNTVPVGDTAPNLPPKQSSSKTAADVPPELPPKVSAQMSNQKEDTLPIPPQNVDQKNDTPNHEGESPPPPQLPPKQSALRTSETSNDDLPPDLPPKLSLNSSSGDVKLSVECRIEGDGQVVEDYSDSSYKTNPDLLKVFHVPEVEGGSKSPASLTSEDTTKQQFSDGVKVQQSKSAMKVDETGVNCTDIRHDMVSKPPLPKSGHRKKSKAPLRRINSEPACMLNSDSSETEEEPEVFTSRKLSLPVAEQNRDVQSPRTAATEMKRRTENTSLAKYIREMQDAGQMKQETHKLEDLKELDEEDLILKEQILNDHIQEMSVSALQEFNSLLAPIKEVDTPLTTPASTFRGGEAGECLGEAGDNELFNRSLAMSEISEISSATVRTEIGDTLVSELHSTGSVSSRGFSGSSFMSSERSHSSNTTTSEPEGELLHWKKGNLLGRGAFGTVYCGLTSVGQLIAVKQVELSEKDKEKSRKQYETLQEEVQLLKTLRHRNIVGFLGCCLEGSSVNIFMQFIPGGSIASLLARFGALDEPVFCRYTKMILDGTEYLHANNVIHRDIKGANIMLMSNGVIKLIDFGCAKRLCLHLSQSQNLLKSMRGTPYWMAPEVIMETGHGKKSDIWSIGCTIYEMACRKPPWSEMPPMPAIFAIGSGNTVPQLPDKFSSEARDFVNLCLTRDQNKRPSAHNLLSHSFIRNRKERFSEQFRRMSGSSLEDSQITFKEQPTNRGDSTGSRSRRMESFK